MRLRLNDPRTASALVGVAVLLLAGCSGDGGDAGRSGGGPSPSATCPSSGPPEVGSRADGPVNRDDVDGDGHTDAVVNGWYQEEERDSPTWRNNRFVLRAAAGGPEPATAFGLTDCYAEHESQSSTTPIGSDLSVHLVGDLDDDGYADILVRGLFTLVGTFGEGEAPEDAGYWILPGTPEGPSTTDCRFVATRDVGQG